MNLSSIRFCTSFYRSIVGRQINNLDSTVDNRLSFVKMCEIFIRMDYVTKLSHTKNTESKT